MADTSSRLNLFPYDGGFDATKHPVLLDPKDLVEMNNIIYTTYNTKKLRPGISEIWTGTSPYLNGRIISSIDFHRSSYQWIVFFDGKKIRARNFSGIEIDITPGAVYLNGENVCFLVYTGLLIAFFPGTTYKPHYWTGSGFMEEIADAPEGCSFGRVWLNSLWVDDPAVPGRLLKSKTGDPLDFTTSDAEEFDLDVNDGDPSGITAIFPGNASGGSNTNNLFVSKRLSLYRITAQYDSTLGSFYFYQSKISDGLGCVSHHSAVAVEDYILFASDRGIHVLSGSTNQSGMETDFLTKDIQPLYVGDLNSTRAAYMRAVYDPTRNCYLIAYPEKGRDYCSSVWGFSLYSKRFFRWQGFEQSCLFRYIDPVDGVIRVGTGSTTGKMGYLNDEIHSDFGVKYGAYLQSGIIIPDGKIRNSYSLSKLAACYVPQSNGKITVSYRVNGYNVESIDFEQYSSDNEEVLGDNFILGSSTLNSIPQIISDTVNTKSYGEFFQFSVEYKPDSSSEEDAGFELLGLVMDLQPTSSSIGRVSG